MIQAAAYRILYCFLSNETQSFTELCIAAGYATDLGGYYIRQLVSGGYVEKVERGQYILTAKGKQQIANAGGKSALALRPRLTVLLVPRQGNKYLALERGRQPFIGTTEWPAGTVRFGETLPTAAKRILRERLNVDGTVEFKGIFRRTDFYLKTDSVFDDKLFAVHTAAIAPDQAAVPREPDRLQVHTAAELATLPRPARSLLDVWKFSQEPVPYLEHAYVLDAADLGL